MRYYFPFYQDEPIYLFKFKIKNFKTLFPNTIDQSTVVVVGGNRTHYPYRIFRMEVWNIIRNETVAKTMDNVLTFKMSDVPKSEGFRSTLTLICFLSNVSIEGNLKNMYQITYFEHGYIICALWTLLKVKKLCLKYQHKLDYLRKLQVL